MRKVLLIPILFIGCFIGCTSKDVDRDLATEVAGTYQVYRYTYYNSRDTRFNSIINLPIIQMSAAIALSKITTTQVKFVKTSNVKGVITVETSTVDLEAEKKGEIIIVEGGKEIGMIKGGELSIDVLFFNGDRKITLARK